MQKEPLNTIKKTIDSIDLKLLMAFVNEMKGTSKVLAKKAIIEKYKNSKFVLEMVEATYNPFKVYHVTSKQLKKYPELCHAHYDGDLKSLLNNLEKRVWTGHEAIAYCNGFIANHSEYVSIVHSILDRNLEVRASDSVFNSVIPNLIPTFKPALANVYNPKLVDLTNERWYASRKLDGVRCLAIIDENGNVDLRSRQGQSFNTLQVVKDAIDSLYLVNTVLDGEICICNENGDEDFQAIMKEIRRKDHTIAKPVFLIFDKFTIETFNAKSGGAKLSNRLLSLTTMMEQYDQLTQDEGCLEYVDQYLLTGDDHFAKWQDISSADEWEGFMIRKDVAYEGKRSNNLLKVKTFHDAEYVVNGCDSREHRVIRNGKEVKIEMLSQVYIEHKGYRVAVGSGFSQEQRIKFHNDPSLIVGKLITCQYFEETQNQDGEWSLRFPVIKHVFDGSRNV